ncbi:MAG: carbamoyltransferase N-terminal domain-containing protein [Bryobacteraceae bacterium]
MVPTYILGLNARIHASAAALIADGQVIAAAQEERFIREKHSGRFPEMAIRYCLREAGLDAGGLDAVAYYWKPWKGLFDRARILLRALPHSLAFFEPHHVARGGPKTLFEHACLKSTLARIAGIQSPVHFVDHQLCHASSAFYPSGFDTAAVLSLDLAGEIDSTLAAIGAGTRLTPLWTTKYPHSLGHFYGAMTQYLGFQPNADEYRVMALAAYGKPSYYHRLKQLVELLPDGQFRLDLTSFVHHWGKDTWYSQRLVDLLGPPRLDENPLTDGRFADH